MDIHGSDINWFGGHSGRRLEDGRAKILDEIWLNYLNSHPSMVNREEAIIIDYWPLFEGTMKICDVCGFSSEGIWE